MSLNLTLNYNITNQSFELLKQHIDKSYSMLENAKIFLDMDKLADFYSRSYYACYHSVNSLFYLYGLLVKSDVFSDNKEISSHYALISFFNRYFIKTGIFDKNFSFILKKFKEYRMAADYRFDKFDKVEAVSDYDEGLNFLNVIKEHIEDGLKKIGKI